MLLSECCAVPTEERVVPIEVCRSKLSKYLQGVVFRCDKCTFTCSSDESLQQHIEKHNELKPYKCQLCYYETKHTEELDAHLRDEHKVRTQLVLICGNPVFAITELVYLHVWPVSLTLGLFFSSPSPNLKTNPVLHIHFSFLSLSFFIVCFFRNWKKKIVSEAIQIDQNWQTAACRVWLSGKGSCVCWVYLKGVGERVVEQYQGSVIQPL